VRPPSAFTQYRLIIQSSLGHRLNAVRLSRAAVPADAAAAIYRTHLLLARAHVNVGMTLTALHRIPGAAKREREIFSPDFVSDFFLKIFAQDFFQIFLQILCRLFFKTFYIVMAKPELSI
jgi:hypothetical protein